MTDRANEILDIAEAEMRKGGIDAVSFRNIAKAVGIKSASVHYHFPTKTHLCKAVVQRYSAGFVEKLGSPSNPNETAKDRIRNLAEGYAAAYHRESAACLCTVLGSMATHLPEEVSKEVQEFFKNLNTWVETAIKGSSSKINAPMIVAILQGAMTVATTNNTTQPILDARDYLMSCIDP